MLNACSGYVFNAVSLKHFVHSFGIRARLRLTHDAEVIFVGHPDDVRTVLPLEDGFLLLPKRVLSTNPHSVLSFSLSCHGQSFRRLKQF